MAKKEELQIRKGNAFPLGVTETERGMQFATVVPKDSVCKLLLYRRGKKEIAFEIFLGQEVCIGMVRSVILSGISFDGLEYDYEIDGKIIPDPYAKRITGREHWASKKWNEQRGRIESHFFDWGNDKAPHIPYNEMILYQIHVRGFTKHISSGVTGRGTFEGVKEKIPYLKRLGVNALFFLPIYEFEERMERESRKIYGMPAEFKETPHDLDNIHLNYWGYTKNSNYFAPKTSYAFDKEEPDVELKSLIKELHQNDMEIILDMFFEAGTNMTMVLDCLRYWILCYHVDGFRVNDNVVPVSFIMQDPVIGSAKLFATSWNHGSTEENCKFANEKLAAEYNDGFMNDSRRFLKGDEGQVNPFIYRMKRNPESFAVINYVTNVNGFTLADLVSYDMKHNEKNGEDGRDGTDYNYSWNCGVEGKTRKKSILSLRKKQMKNAVVMLLLSQGTPMLLAGDEFGNSQDGNNNAYCQDNGTSWLNWKLLEKNSDLFEFIQKLILLRKTHPILHMKKELKVMDYALLGCPDISFHGTKAWYLDASNYSRVLGIMLCGEYAYTEYGQNDCDFYIAYNMHWESHTFDLPRLFGKKYWGKLLDTSEEVEAVHEVKMTSYLVKPRSIVIFQSKMTPEN
ncbi:alpha-amylase family glycosyl hydrolase [Velocimicrobium porci]|uniref:Alpha-amylase n=1 Tax=Velocimicrobium porci TaxID=2606634 RepID=A0A6L5XZX7_9FIRM|nr:alpha-amylase family glycosyl hydrolase [Velocimicrobium porci]MSS64264.1 alpha-amylase [Velocimicrobium porci]